jgi:hypothetical protein
LVADQLAFQFGKPCAARGAIQHRLIVTRRLPPAAFCFLLSAFCRLPPAAFILPPVFLFFHNAATIIQQIRYAPAFQL